MTVRAINDAPWPSLVAQRWADRRTFRSGRLPSAAKLAERKRADGVRISVALPALNEGATVGAICETIARDLMDDVALVDQLVVLDGGSDDETAAEATRAGARIVDVARVLPDIPYVRGKGESLWRSLSAVSGDIVVWIDADIKDFKAHFVERLVAPLLLDEEIDFVKGYYGRPISHGDTLVPGEGGRVTELLARPLLAAMFPELGGFHQPLSGEYAGRRDVLSRLPFLTGYSVEVALLIDLLDVVGLDGMAQVDLEERVHRNRPLQELGPMAYAIARTILRRAEERGRMKAALDYATAPLLLSRDGELEMHNVFELERPPMEMVPVLLDALRGTGSDELSRIVAVNG